MIYKTLGNSSLHIPAIGQGSTGMGGYANYDPVRIRARIKTLRLGVEMGLSYIDTAELYGGGLSEEVVSEAIKGQREEVFLASKFNPRVPARTSIEQSVDGSLRRLKTDYIDLYQMHWPNPTIPWPEVMEALASLLDMGKIRFIGLSNVSLVDFEEAQSSLPERKIVSVQTEFNLMDRSVEDHLLPYCCRNSVTMLAYSPLNQGRIFWGKNQRELLLDLSTKYGKTMSQIVIRWLIHHCPVVVITKSNDPNHTMENARSADFDLESEDVDRIDRLRPGNISEVPLNEIRLDVSRDRPVYMCKEEALENRFDLIPSPWVLSKIILKTNTMRPIRLVATRDESGKYRYDIDGYDINDNAKKYWAWLIAFGEARPVPAYILDNHDRGDESCVTLN